MQKILVIILLVSALALSGCLTAIDDFDSSRDKRCFLEPDPGPCEAAIPRFYLGEDGKCHQFLWGGCNGVAPFESLEECRKACGIRVVMIQDVFEHKVVYTTDASADTAPLKEDCAERGGTFNECGTTCETDSGPCAAVCAFTCELGEDQLGEDNYFAEKLREKGVEIVGFQPIEGFDAFILLQTFPGLAEEDFEGVEALQGTYKIKDGKLELEYEPDASPIHSAGTTVSDRGMKTLLENVSTRLGITVSDNESTDALITLLSEAVNCPDYNAETCPGNCVVCPPCEECSSISCQTEEFCKSLGFDKNWYETVKP